MTGPGYQKFDAVIIDPELDTRMRLKQATSSVHQFGKVHQQQSLREAMGRLSGDERCDVIFISYRFEQPEIVEFIKQAKGTKSGQDAAYVMLMRSKDQDATKVATNVMIGADGFLFEPYSVDYLVEITNLAAKVRKERADTRERGALTFLVNDIINQLDLVSSMKAQGFEVVTSMKKLKEMCTVFSTLSPESFQVYTDVAIKQFGDAPVPKKIAQKKYGGASSRVKKKLEQKIAAEMTATSGATKAEAK